MPSRACGADRSARCAGVVGHGPGPRAGGRGGPGGSGGRDRSVDGHAVTAHPAGEQVRRGRARRGCRADAGALDVLQPHRRAGGGAAHVRVGGDAATDGEPAAERSRRRRRAARGQVQIDSTPIDVLVLLDNGVAVRADLTIAVDVAARTICAAVLRPVGTKAVDAALLLARMLVPEPMRWAGRRRCGCRRRCCPTSGCWVSMRGWSWRRRGR